MGGIKVYIVLNFGGHLAPNFCRKGVKVQNWPPISPKLGAFGSRKFFPPIGGLKFY